MTYVGAFVTHGDDPELYIVTGKVSAGARVRILKWGKGLVRTAREKDVLMIPALVAVERLRILIVAQTPKGNHDVLDGKEDLVAAAYAYISSHESAFHTERMARRTSLSAGRVDTSVAAKKPHKPQPAQHPRHLKPPVQSEPSSKILPYEEDFIREGVITEMVASNLVLTDAGQIEVLGTKVDLCRLIQIYCATAGVSAPTKSLMLRRIRDITTFLSQGDPDPTVIATPRGLILDIKGMEP
ncbi:hypothetical protein [Pseudomonas lundensis]|jgi:hypothetical protein|uniref:hypothetical protein n=1 Tax=Pseudomonas lundensis TaxID=86185 RepID=UPI0014748E70|nr:hypothetical protein [Pseudomonas lundensis]NNA04672.1 hypothetical protein [Pseudomonas lundensis]